MDQSRTCRIRRFRPEGGRRDGWTPERQLRFLAALARTRSVTRAAAAAGMSRESAYRLRARRDGALFAAAWDRALRRSSLSKGHNIAGTSRRLARAGAGKIRENSPKVTKWKKCKDPCFHTAARQLRDLWEASKKAVTFVTLDGPREPPTSAS